MKNYAISHVTDEHMVKDVIYECSDVHNGNLVTVLDSEGNAVVTGVDDEDFTFIFNVQGEPKSIFQGTVPAPFYAERSAPFEITRLDFNIDRHPFVGFKDVSIEAIARDDMELSPYYDNWPGYPQVTEVTRGKRYHIYKVEGHGDVFDAFFLNDRGEEQSEPSYLFKDAK